ncbi:hypothetical protein MVEN_01301900 [Mycena venus]|uniref:Uncharacterized protein n=1 Tax=Mycena venus TaxID=2733690 RepID=A0A8H6XYM8_9AGAR|nr:hypothetical protein MVEN_01301900 [Mycena venus]
MPARGDRNAPQFDSQKPHELRRYFTDLEFLFDRSAVTDNTERKKHATRFLPVEDQEIWEALTSFADAAKSYAEFKAAVLKLYAGNDEDRRFGLSDLDALIGQYARTGILSKEDLTTFYRQFLRITTYLPASFALEVKQRLQIKRPDNHPEDPYALTDLLEAAEFVIAGGGTSAALVASVAPSSITLPAPIEVKPDPGIAALVGTVAELIKVLATQNNSSSTGAASSSPKKPRSDGCGYCSDLDHFINQCQRVLEDIRAGKCRRNTDGRVVLPSGAFVPRTIQGKDLRTRIEEWHRQNPGQLATAQLLVEVAVDHLSANPAYSPAPAQRTFTLSAEDRIQMLEMEINAIRTRSQAKRALEANNRDEEPERTIPPPNTRAAASPKAPAAADVAPPAKATVTPAPKAPQHPFSDARDAAYAPPKERNFGIPPPKPSGPAYRTSAPVYNEKDATAVFDASLDSPVTITQRQLLSIAPEVRAHMREATTSRRLPPKDNKNARDSIQQFFHGISDPLPFVDELDTLEQQRARDAQITAMFDSLPASYVQSAQSNLPAGGFIVPDPYSVYYDTGSVPDDLIVSMESSAIRSILPIIDNREQVECIVDGGSQINAMSEAICHELALTYDPRVVLRMQSANGAITPSLGLARNVPFPHW